MKHILCGQVVNCLFTEHCFYLKNWGEKDVYETWVSVRYFFKNTQSHPLTWRKTTDYICDKIQVFKWKLEFGKPLPTSVSSTLSQDLQTSLTRSVVIIANLIFKIFYQEIGQHLEDLYNLLNQHLSNDVRTSCMSKRQDRHMDVDVTEYRMFIDMVSDPTVQLTFKKFPLVLV